MDHTRHRDIFRAEDVSATLIGAGGIGAATALALAKMGVGQLVIYDDDRVSEENMPTQLHRLSDLGREKVFGIEEIVQMFSDDTQVFPISERVTANVTLRNYIVISAVDSIQARKDIWEAVKQGVVRWYLDARMAAEEFHLYTVDMHNEAAVERYEDMLSAETDENIADIACTMKATIYCSFLAAAIIGRTVRQIATSIVPPRIYVQSLVTDAVISFR